MRAVAHGMSDVGLQRDHNEDSFAILNEFRLYVVADGMGGHKAGDVASRLATVTIEEFFRDEATGRNTWPFHFDTRLSDEENRLLMGIRLANRQIVDQSSRSREHQGMGTTVVSALFSPGKGRMYIGHVGDSRAYRVRAGEIRQMTRDHSLVNDYLSAMPDLTDEQKSELPKNVITRALGMQEQVSVDIQSDDVELGDVYVLCSDGLCGMMADADILSLVSDTQDLEAICRHLIVRANENGGDDNITAVVVRIEDGPEDSTKKPQHSEVRDSSPDRLVSLMSPMEVEDTQPGGVPVPPELLAAVKSEPTSS